MPPGGLVFYNPRLGAKPGILIPRKEDNMARFGITLSNGHCLRWVIASGGLAFDGRGYWFERPLLWSGRIKPKLFIVAVKTLTMSPKRGNLKWWKRFGGCVRLLDKRGQALNELEILFSPHRIDGIVNAVGLTNSGFLAWAKKWQDQYRYYGYKIIISVMPTDIAEAKTMAQTISCLAKQNPELIAAAELNPSCPNCIGKHQLRTNSDEVTMLALVFKQYCPNLPLLLKVGPQQDYLTIAENLSGVVEAISFNSVPWDMVFPDQPSPLNYLGVNGGISGKLAQPILWPMVQSLVQQGIIPAIGPSVWDFPDISSLLWEMGASAIHFGAIHLRGLQGPTLPTRYVKQW